MRVLVLHDAVSDSSRADERDALVQAEAVSAALRRLGHDVSVSSLTLNLEAAADEIRARRPDCVFNLVESVGGHGRLIHLGPALFDALAVPYTGAGVEAMLITTSKVLARRFMPGVPMPRCFTGNDLARGVTVAPGRYIVKSVWEEASLGLDDDSVVEVRSADELARLIAARAPRLGGEAFAEAFIDGREFNLSLLADGSGDEISVLPPAEIRFDGFPAHKPRIVSYAAKWDEASFEYQKTPRSFDLPAADAELVQRLVQISRACWSAVGLTGYARVDFRVDTAGNPFVLEINANPCLSPDAGFAAAATRAGLLFDAVVDRIVLAALRRRK